MFEIAHGDLRAELLDPVADRTRLGARYAWGGFVWQVHHRHLGPLLTGPEWPDPAPQPHNGQGLPESFRHSTTTGEPLLWDGEVGLAPGAGTLARDAHGAAFVTEPCSWQTEPGPARILFRTAQSVGRWSYALERTLELHDGRLVSHSRLTNRAPTPLRLEWFAHPFFALPAGGGLRATLPPEVALADNPGYLLRDGELTLRRPFVGVHDGHLVHLGLPAGRPFSVALTHPRLAFVRFATDFVPFKCVLWANGNTLSFEPFLALDLAPGAARTWTLTYEFGPPLP